MPKTYRFKATGSVLLIIFITFTVLTISLKVIDYKNSVLLGEFVEKQLAREDKRVEELSRENEQLKQQLNTKIQVQTKIQNSPEVKARALKAAADKWGYDQVNAFEQLINSESGFNLFSLNKSSGACGIFQALPCSKLPGLDLESQLSWGINYIEARYQTPSNALAFHLQKGWY